MRSFEYFTPTKVIYGKENLREIITNLLEEKFNEIIEQCEDQ